MVSDVQLWDSFVSNFFLKISKFVLHSLDFNDLILLRKSYIVYMVRHKIFQIHHQELDSKGFLSQCQVQPNPNYPQVYYWWIG